MNTEAYHFVMIVLQTIESRSVKPKMLLEILLYFVVVVAVVVVAVEVVVVVGGGDIVAVVVDCFVVGIVAVVVMVSYLVTSDGKYNLVTTLKSMVTSMGA
mgnify:CR=1 FL=1